jgi:uncharacterized protein (TIGR02594 family)
MTIYELAQRYVGIREIAGDRDHPLIQWWFALCGFSADTSDETPWCSAFINGMAWELRLPRSKSAAARSWLAVGTPIPLEAAQLGDVVIFKRGEGIQPGPEVIAAPGHVGLYAGREGNRLLILGGNQSDGVCIAGFGANRVLGVRRLV